MADCFSSRSIHCPDAVMYEDTTAPSYEIAKSNIPLIINALGSIPHKKGTAFTVCDYGTADGGASFPLMESIVEHVKKLHGANTEVVIIYEDQPFNDFKSLFLRTQGLIPGTKKLAFSDVYYFASGTSFYEQCCQSSSVHVGYSSMAVHWLSTRPCLLTDAVLCHSSNNEHEREMFALQASKDWETILEARGKELVTGGVVVIYTLARNEAYVGTTDHGKTTHYKFDGIWKSMIDDGLITKDEFHNMAVSFYFRNETELRAPFNNSGNRHNRSGLVLESCTSGYETYASYDKWLQGKPRTACAANSYAQHLTAAVRMWIENPFLHELDTRRSPEERAKIMRTFFQRFEQRAAAAPDEYHNIVLMATLCLRKESQ